MARAVLYLPDAASPALAGRPVAGRSVAFRALMAAARAGALAIAVPTVLRSPQLERAVRRVHGLRGRVRWLEPEGEADRAAFTSEPCLLLPASALLDPPALRALLEGPGESAAVALAGSVTGGAPALLAPPALTAELWERLAAGRPLGAELSRYLETARPALRGDPGAFVTVRSESDLGRVEAILYRATGTELDTPVDRILHRRCSRWLTRALVRTPVTPNQVSLASLAVGAVAAWCFWGATPASAAVGIALYALACVLDHSDGELARLTFQESRLGAHLDWTIDTAIHALLVLAMAVTAGGAVLVTVGALAALGVVLSALCVRTMSRARSGPPAGGTIREIGNRDLFYVVLLAFALLRWLAPVALPALVAVVAVGSQVYWIACVRRLGGAGGARQRR